MNEGEKRLALNSIREVHRQVAAKLLDNKLKRMSTAVHIAAELPGKIERGYYIGEISITFGVQRDIVEKEVNEYRFKLLCEASPNKDLIDRAKADQKKKGGKQ